MSALYAGHHSIFSRRHKVSRPHGGFVLWVQLNKKSKCIQITDRSDETSYFYCTGKNIFCQLRLFQLYSYQFWQTLE